MRKNTIYTFDLLNQLATNPANEAGVLHAIGDMAPRFYKDIRKDFLMNRIISQVTQIRDIDKLWKKTMVSISEPAAKMLGVEESAFVEMFEDAWREPWRVLSPGLYKAAFVDLLSTTSDIKIYSLTTDIPSEMLRKRPFEILFVHQFTPIPDSWVGMPLENTDPFPMARTHESSEWSEDARDHRLARIIGLRKLHGCTTEVAKKFIDLRYEVDIYKAAAACGFAVPPPLITA